MITEGSFGRDMCADGLGRCGEKDQSPFAGDYANCGRSKKFSYQEAARVR